MGRDAPSRLGGLGERLELPQRGLGRSLGRKRILAYFEYHRSLFFASIWRCFAFVKQCFMSHLGVNKCNCAPILNFSPNCPIGDSAKGKLQTAYSWQFLPRFSTVFGAPFGINCKSRQFLRFRGSFLPVLHCLSLAMHLFSSCICSADAVSSSTVFHVRWQGRGLGAVAPAPT